MYSFFRSKDYLSSMTTGFEQRMAALANEAQENVNALLPLTVVYVEAVANRMDLADYYEEKVVSACKPWIGKAVLASGIQSVVKAQGHYYRAQFEDSIREARQAMEVFQELEITDLYGAAHMLLGGNYRSLGELDDSVNHLMIAAEHINPTGEFSIFSGYSYYQLGEIYASIKDFDAAEHSYMQVANNKAISNQITPWFRALNGLGNLFLAKKDHEKALDYFNKAMEFANIPTHRSRGLCDLGNYYLELNDLDQAESAYQQSFDIRKANHADDAASTSLIGLSKTNIKKGEHQKAIKQIQEALDTSIKFNAKSKILQCYRILGDIYADLKQWQEAYSYRLKYDELYEDITSQQLQNIYKLKNKKIEVQKAQIEQAHGEIKDSINYAKRIQEAIMPGMDNMLKNLNDAFVIYLPKDVVAGDFYWLEVVDDVIYFAAADCTGHGVPGAMVSVVCSNALSKALTEDGIRNTGELLDRTRELVISRLARSGEEVNDGMDISLCAWNKKTNELQWSGANNPLWIIRPCHPEQSRGDFMDESLNKEFDQNLSLTTDNYQLYEFKPDKQPIGKTPSPSPFTSHQIQLHQNDTFFVFTDGYYDQFGGEKGKKMKAANFKKLLISLSKHNMADQKEAVARAFHSWKGNLDQLDDVCVIGVRI